MTGRIAKSSHALLSYHTTRLGLRYDNYQYLISPWSDQKHSNGAAKTLCNSTLLPGLNTSMLRNNTYINL